MDAGSALGFGVGPMLITKDEHLAKELQDKLSAQASLTTALQQLSVGYPGKYTTANFLLGLAFPELKNKKSLSFQRSKELCWLVISIWA